MMRRMFVSFLFALAPLAVAQSVADLLPAETMFALGTTNLNAHENLLDDFIAEFEARGVAAALGDVFGDLEALSNDEGLDTEIPPELEGLGALDVLGDEAWIAVSASSFNPLPVVTLAARMSPAATAALADLIADATTQDGVQAFSEGGIDFWVLPVDEPDMPVQGVAFAQANGISVLSTNPDVLRGVLRRMAGSDEPGLTDSAGYAETLGTLGDGQFHGYFDIGAFARVAAPYAQGLGFGPQIERLQRALVTAGQQAGVIRIVSDGLQSEGISVPDPDGGDIALYNLLTTPGSHDPASLQFVPTTGLQVSSGYTDLTGWWNYLNDLVGSLPEFGIQSLDGVFRDMAGIDIRATFFDWTGTHVATVTTGVAAVTQPGMPAANLLGEQVYAIETIDADAARQGLSVLFSTATMLVSGFTDPSGGEGGAAISQVEMHGVTVDVYEVAQGLELVTAVTGQYALIATSRVAMDAALGASAQASGLPPAFADLYAGVPAGARSVTLSDTRALIEGSALNFAQVMQLGAGFGGGDLDFDAVNQAVETVEGYLLFVASRLGGSVSHANVVDGTIRSEGSTQIFW